MDKSQILVSVFLTLLKCEEFTMQNVTFSYTKKSWNDAVNNCSKGGGVLESNVTLLKEQDEFQNVNEVWIGQFRTFTSWTYIRGCYLINGNLQHFELDLSHITAELQCQMLCNNYKFYSTKDADCYCIANISSFVRSKNCSCAGCYKVWEHQLPTFVSEEGKLKCIATTACDGGKFIRSYKKCDDKTTKYNVICDNGAKIGFDYSSYKVAAEKCKKLDSLIKWHADDLCTSPGLPQYWTSGTRHDETFVIRKAYFTENLQPDKCFILKNNGKIEDEDDCDNINKHRYFFCRFDTDEDKGDIVSIPNIWIPTQKNIQSHDAGGIAAGIVTSIIVIIVVISVLVFIYRRRLSRKKPTSHELPNNIRLQDTVGLPSNNETSKDPVYHEIEAENFGPNSRKLNSSRTIHNITYDQAPNSQNLNQSENPHVNSIEHKRIIGQTEYDIPKLINKTGSSFKSANSSNYCLAEPITINTEEESDPYDINKDYDHLNNVQKKEDQITKVYDHLPTAVTEDPTYDHSNLKNALDNEDFYDHFKNEGYND